MTRYVTRGLIAAIAFGLFGIFLILKGITGNIAELSVGRPMFPRSVYSIAGLILLLIPVIYLLVTLKKN